MRAGLMSSLNQLDATAAGGHGPARNPFLLPDGRWVGFFVGSELRKVSVAGRPSAGDHERPGATRRQLG